MRRSKQSTAAATTTIRPTGEQVEALTVAVDLLRQQVQILSDTLDHVREELQWAINNREEFRCEPRRAMHITSMPKDALAEDFGERINRYSAKDLPALEQVSAQPPPHCLSRQGDLFE